MTAACHYHLPPSRLNLHQRFTLSLSLSLSQTVRSIWPKPISTNFRVVGLIDSVGVHLDLLLSWFQWWWGGEAWGSDWEWVSWNEGVRVRRDWGRRELLLATEEMRDLGLDNSYIYRGYFCNFRETGFYLGRVSDFFDKTRTCFGFFF